MNENLDSKRVLFLITKSNWGGAQKYVYELSKSLKESGVDVSVGLGGDGLLKDRLEEIDIKVHKIEGLDRNIGIFKEFKVLYKLIKLYRKIKPDIIHLNSSKIGGIGSLAGRLSGIKKIIFTAHGWAFKEDVNITSKLFRKILSWLTIILSHKVIVLSEKERDMVSGWIGAKNKIKVIPIGLKFFELLGKDEARKILKEKYPELANTPTKWILSNGELTRNKGYKYSLDGFAQSDVEAQYIIFGDGEDAEDLYEITKNHPKLGTSVSFLGYVEDGSKYLKAFDIFLLPSVKEGLPYVLLEAGFVGLPIIATNVGGISEIIKEETGILINPRKEEEIARALEFLIDNRDVADSFGKNLKEEIKEKYNFENMNKETVELYKD